MLTSSIFLYTLFLNIWSLWNQFFISLQVEIRLLPVHTFYWLGSSWLGSSISSHLLTEIYTCHWCWSFFLWINYETKSPCPWDICKYFSFYSRKYFLIKYGPHLLHCKVISFFKLIQPSSFLILHFIISERITGHIVCSVNDHL